MEIKNGLQIHSYDGAGYLPLVDYESWRVAMLNPQEPSKSAIETMQRHMETDEVFVLLTGKCVLFVASDKDEPENLHGEFMEPLKVYNVPKAYWHASALSDGSSVLIVENRDTTAANSPHINLNGAMKTEIIKIREGYLK